MDDSDLGEVGSLSLRECFRCKGLAVIDVGHLRMLDKVMERARYLLMQSKFDTPEDMEEAWGVGSSLKMYADMIDSMSINGRES